MGNNGSYHHSSSSGNNGSGRRRHRNQHHNNHTTHTHANNHLQAPLQPSGPPPPPQQEGNSYVFAAQTPYPAQYPNPSPPHFYNYNGYYPPQPMQAPMPAPYDDDHHHHRMPNGGHLDSRRMYPYGVGQQAAPLVDHQRAVTIKNDVNLKKETLKVVPDEENPGMWLVAFTFDATVSGSITVIFFAKEGVDCNLAPATENLFQPITVSFKQGLGQTFRQPSGTGIDFTMFKDIELMKESDMEVFPLAIKAEASLLKDSGLGGNLMPRGLNSQITQAVFEKEKGEFQVRVVKQILWVNGMRYELQEIYGIGNSVDGDFDANDPGKECVICLSEPRDTTVLPCRHMCMCSECAKVLIFQTNRCPICRQPVERLLEIKVNNRVDE